MKANVPANGVVFVERKTEDAFVSLEKSSPLKKSIIRTISKLKENVYSGERISNKLIPKEYLKKYKIDNLFWYRLSKDWRLVYSVVGNKVEVLAVIIEYFNHKKYERRFNY